MQISVLYKSFKLENSNNKKDQPTAVSEILRVSFHHSSSLVHKKQVKVSYTQFAESGEQKRTKCQPFPLKKAWGGHKNAPKGKV